MNDSPENELLSAYLDGELTAAEQAQVERLLAASPRARQVLDELRALSTTLQSLPQHKLDKDLSAAVLRAAERQILVGERPADEAAPQPLTPFPRPTLRGIFSRRALLWTAATVAVALFVMIQEKGGLKAPVVGPVAQAPAKRAVLEREPGPPPSIGAAPGHDAAKKASDEGLAAKPDSELRFAEAPRDLKELAEPKSPAGPGKDALAIVAGESATDGAAPATAPVVALPAMPAAKPAIDSLAAKDVLLDSNERNKDGSPRATAGRMSKGGAAQIRSRAADGLKEAAAGATANLADAKNTADREQVTQAEEKQAGGLLAKAVPPGAALDQEAKELELVDADHAADAVLVVRCNISAEAAGKQVLAKLLSDHKIAANESRKSKSGFADAMRRDAPAKFRQEANRAKQAGLELVYFEATPAQIEAALDQMAAEPENYLSVQVEPSPNLALRGSGSAFAAPAPMHNSAPSAAMKGNPGGKAAADWYAAQNRPAMAKAEGGEKMPLASKRGASKLGGSQDQAKPALPTADQPAPAEAIAQMAKPAEKLAERSADGPANQPADRWNKEADEKATAEASPPAQYRVLFVVQVAAPSIAAEVDVKAAAAAKIEAKPAEAAAPASAAPAKQ